jgi:hypothetical protein
MVGAVAALKENEAQRKNILFCPQDTDTQARDSDPFRLRCSKEELPGMLQAEMSKKVSQICSATKSTVLGTFDFNWFSSFNNQYHRKFYSPYRPQQIDTNISGRTELVLS